MEKYLEIIKNSYSSYWNYLKQSVLMDLNWENYFYGLIIISIVVWGLEAVFPWRKDQPLFRKDFWLDVFYMFFNFFLLNLIVLIALSNSAAEIFNDLLGLVGISISSFQLLEINKLPFAARILLFFIVVDFTQWWTHRLLHRFEFLWNLAIKLNPISSPGSLPISKNHLSKLDFSANLWIFVIMGSAWSKSINLLVLDNPHTITPFSIANS